MPARSTARKTMWICESTSVPPTPCLRLAPDLAIHRILRVPAPECRIHDKPEAAVLTNGTRLPGWPATRRDGGLARTCASLRLSQGDHLRLPRAGDNGFPIGAEDIDLR